MRKPCLPSSFSTPYPWEKGAPGDPDWTTCSYSEIARRLGDLEATRAVGAANGANPLPIVVPCHRVIGADGSLVGSGGGLDVKRYFLRLEGVLPDTDLFDPPLPPLQPRPAP